MDKVMLHLKYLGITPFGSDAFRPASLDQFSTFESELGSHLPLEYRWLMTTYGSFTFQHTVCARGSTGLLYHVGFFLSAAEVLEYFRSLPDHFPPGCIPIAEDGVGDMFCLGVQLHNAGKIFHWTHDIGWGDEAEVYLAKEVPIPDSVPTPCLHRIAETVTLFIEKLERSD